MQEQEQESFKKRYKIINRISEGNFGCVFKAQDNQTNGCYEEIICEFPKLKIETNHRKRNQYFKNEQSYKCKKDPNQVIQLLNYKIKETSVTIVLEYCEYDLFTFLENITYPIDNQITQNIGNQILQGLNYIHKNNIIHRDLKPSNILITQQGIVKIADFGSATLLQDNNQEFEIEGFTRWYKSPEQLFGSRNYDQQIDMWAFGCIMAEIIQGYPLFTSMNEIEQISKISKILGSPDENNWPNIQNMPDFGKIKFQESEPQDLDKILINSLKIEIQFLKQIIKYQDRLTSEQVFLNKKALKHDYFDNIQTFSITQCLQNFKQEKQPQILDYTKIVS